MRVRATRNERREQTRAEIVSAARRVFLRRGLHPASLDEIAAEAGFTKGAVYSNFAGKDDLFLAVLDAHFAEREVAFGEVALEHESIEETYRAVARFMVQADGREPGWSPLMVEFFAHAARHEALRQALVARRERYLGALADLVDTVAERHGVRYRLPTADVVRGSGCLWRGMSLERLLEPEPVSAGAFEEMHVAYMAGLHADATPARRSERSRP